MFRKVSLLISAALFAPILFLSAGSAQEVKRSITQIAGDLYRFQNRFHNSVFLVTPDGVIATDPINADAAKWLEDEIAKRFDKKIRYVIYSHDHRDHIAGGEVWADDAVVISHELAKRAIIAEKRPTAVPDVTFNDKMTVELGGKKVHLTYVGPSHSDNLIVMHFPDERALFAVDFISVKRVAFRNLSDSYWPGWVEAIKKVEGMDFDILVPGHGPNGTKEDAADHRKYLEALYNGVLAGVREGKSLEQIKASVDLSAYKAWGQFADWSPLNVEGVYNRIVLQRRGN